MSTTSNTAGIHVNETIALTDRNTQTESRNIAVEYTINWEIQSNAYFLSVFLPVPDAWTLTHGYDILYVIRDQLKSAIAKAQNVGMSAGPPVGPKNNFKEAIFSGVVYIYTETELNDIQRGQLAHFYKNDNMDLVIRGSDYLFWRTDHKSAS